MSGRPTVLAATLAGLALAGCDGFRLVDPGSGAARFQASVHVTHDDSARYLVNAFFQRPGPGAAHRVRDLAIVVDGARVEPGWTSPTGAVSYTWQETRPASDPRTGTLVVRGPELADGSAAAVPLRLVARGDGPAWPAPGEDLLLRVLTLASGAIGRPDARWSLDVRDACAPGSTIPMLSVIAAGPVPPEVRIPRNLLPDPLPSSFEVCLTASDAFDLADAPYQTFGLTFARLVWRVTP